MIIFGLGYYVLLSNERYRWLLQRRDVQSRNSHFVTFLTSSTWRSWHHRLVSSCQQIFSFYQEKDYWRACLFLRMCGCVFLTEQHKHRNTNIDNMSCVVTKLGLPTTGAHCRARCAWAGKFFRKYRKNSLTFVRSQTRNRKRERTGHQGKGQNERFKVTVELQGPRERNRSTGSFTV